MEKLSDPIRPYDAMVFCAYVAKFSDTTGYMHLYIFKEVILKSFRLIGKIELLKFIPRTLLTNMLKEGKYWCSLILFFVHSFSTHYTLYGRLSIENNLYKVHTLIFLKNVNSLIHHNKSFSMLLGYVESER